MSQSDIEQQINSQYEDDRLEILESLANDPPIVCFEAGSIDYLVVPFEDECVHYFTPLKITRSAENFSYFFALSLQNRKAEWNSGFLSFQLNENFNSSFKEFASFLICLIADTEAAISESTKSFIRDWIDLNRYLQNKESSGICPEAKLLKESVQRDQLFTYILTNLSIEDKSKGFKRWFSEDGQFIFRGKGYQSAASELLNYLIDGDYFKTELLSRIKADRAYFINFFFGVKVGKSSTKTLNKRKLHYDELRKRIKFAKNVANQQ